MGNYCWCIKTSPKKNDSNNYKNKKKVRSIKLNDSGGAEDYLNLEDFSRSQSYMNHINNHSQQKEVFTPRSQAVVASKGSLNLNQRDNKRNNIHYFRKDSNQLVQSKHSAGLVSDKNRNQNKLQDITNRTAQEQEQQQCLFDDLTFDNNQCLSRIYHKNLMSEQKPSPIDRSIEYNNDMSNEYDAQHRSNFDYIPSQLRQKEFSNGKLQRCQEGGNFTQKVIICNEMLANQNKLNFETEENKFQEQSAQQSLPMEFEEEQIFGFESERQKDIRPSPLDHQFSQLVEKNFKQQFKNRLGLKSQLLQNNLESIDSFSKKMPANNLEYQRTPSQSNLSEYKSAFGGGGSCTYQDYMTAKDYQSCMSSDQIHNISLGGNQRIIENPEASQIESKMQSDKGCLYCEQQNIQSQ
ncbi:UNKNOWN [Stylonychia lemnae]|uniref:Uncharacterized protein n=1 Tax=Stylonychia lemnae TaxID=5949 RepID=A0A078B008_STYLE|nr:UNKNOWN [Stylonychia lemnae]|eukprot:CDW87834.1 UNKNOWN [Stylonychia lemnae]